MTHIPDPSNVISQAPNPPTSSSSSSTVVFVYFESHRASRFNGSRLKPLALVFLNVPVAQLNDNHPALPPLSSPVQRIRRMSTSLWISGYTTAESCFMPGGHRNSPIFIGCQWLSTVPLIIICLKPTLPNTFTTSRLE